MFIGDTLLGTATGNLAVTAPAFQGDVLVMLGVNSSGVLPINVATDPGVSLGVAVSTAQRWSIALGSRDGRSNQSNFGKTQRIDRCYRVLAREALVQSVDFVSHDALGFTVTKVAADVAVPTDKRMAYLYIKGGKWSAGSFPQPTVLGQQTVTGVGLRPLGLLFAGWNNAANTAILTGRTDFYLGGASFGPQ